MCKLNSSRLSRKEEERKKPRQKDGIEIGFHITFNTCERAVLTLDCQTCASWYTQVVANRHKHGIRH